ncbi:ABC transporter ATP-binding protein [Streptomyces sp. NPDC059785]|uniref:ABC transporter ATP-binding protein n=1 Tax=Streptomyces sp. NPDC059785 TaxID=3346945 RepID=UPI003665D265
MSTVPVQNTAAALDPLVSFDGADKVYTSGFRALAPIDLRLPRAEITVLVGPSGCGKSTLLRMAAGLTTPSTGGLSRRTERMSYVFQDPTLLAWRSIRANVELVARLQGVPRAERRERAQKAIGLVGLQGFEKAYPRELSGGMKMRASLARSLTSDPELLLMDEPFAALDEFNREKMGAELIHLWRTRRVTVMFVTHSIPEAVRLGHQVAVMGTRPGRVIEVLRSPSPPTADPGAPRDEAALRDLRTEISAMLGGTGI